MKNLRLFILLNLFSSFVTFGQNYQTVISNRISYFENPYGNIKCIRIDSAIHLVDSTLYPLSNIREKDYGCFTPFGDSWIGEKIIKKENGLNIFFNRDHDSIKVKTNTRLNDSWTAFTLSDSIKITATVISHDTLRFLGLLDSVKTIGFQVYDKNSNLLNYWLNNMELKISKNFGFVGTLNFYLFPYLDDYSGAESIEEYSLIGLSNPTRGVQNLTWFEIHDFQPGDELHILDETSNWGGRATSLKTIFKYLSRTDYEDSIEYTLSFKRDYQVTSPDTSFDNYTQSLEKVVIRSEPDFDKLPGEPILDGYGGAYSYAMNNGSVISKKRYGLEIYQVSDDLCWQPILDGGYMEYIFLKGLGGPYYQYDEIMTHGVRKIVYYKKENVSWGTPLIITGIPEKVNPENISVFPNPARKYISIRIKNYNQTEIFEIFDMTGRILLKKDIISEESNIGIEDLEPGTYIYRLLNDNKLVKTDKLIIK